MYFNEAREDFKSGKREQPPIFYKVSSAREERSQCGPCMDYNTYLFLLRLWDHFLHPLFPCFSTLFSVSLLLQKTSKVLLSYQLSCQEKPQYRDQEQTNTAFILYIRTLTVWTKSDISGMPYCISTDYLQNVVKECSNSMYK